MAKDGVHLRARTGLRDTRNKVGDGQRGGGNGIERDVMDSGEFFDIVQFLEIWIN